MPFFVYINCMEAQKLRKFFTVLIVLTAVVLFAIGGMAWQMYKLQNKGVKVTGTVQSLEKTMCNKTLCYLYTVAYTAPNGSSYTVLLNLGSAYKPQGTQLALICNPHSPEDVELYSGAAGVQNAGVAAGFLLAVIAVLVWGRRNTEKVAGWFAKQ